ncbi:hypothetical protein PCASD_19828 [Puccinia coronata f. sp. avenae]|uniref:Uncharacterized protein n=1 Tax=Puccinia coronata f. sp. avenae TaxID=200324 RepID=A0A2N5SDE1_9BASI|nr:hypothetical protein PCASD_19828 [Puccinia coronata f. sp. avenae]
MSDKPVREACPTWDRTELSDPMSNTFVRLLLKIFERPHNSQTIGPMSYELIGQWLFDMGSNTLSNPTLKKSVKQPCPTWDRTEWSNPMSDKMC